MVGERPVEIDRQTRHIAHEQIDRRYRRLRTCRPRNTSGRLPSAARYQIGLIHGEHQRAIGRIWTPGSVATCQRRGWVELAAAGATPRARVAAQPHRRCSCVLQQLAASSAAQAVPALSQFGLPAGADAPTSLNTSSKGALRRRHLQRPLRCSNRPTCRKGGWLLIERARGGTRPGSVRWNHSGRRAAVQLTNAAPAAVTHLAYRPVERRLATDVQALEPALQQQQAGMQGRCRSDEQTPADRAREARPADVTVIICIIIIIMDNQVRDTSAAKSSGSSWRPRCQPGVEHGALTCLSWS